MTTSGSGSVLAGLAGAEIGQGDCPGPVSRLTPWSQLSPWSLSVVVKGLAAPSLLPYRGQGLARPYRGLGLWEYRGTRVGRMEEVSCGVTTPWRLAAMIVAARLFAPSLS